MLARNICVREKRVKLLVHFIRAVNRTPQKDFGRRRFLVSIHKPVAIHFKHFSNLKKPSNRNTCATDFDLSQVASIYAK